MKLWIFLTFLFLFSVPTDPLDEWDKFEKEVLWNKIDKEIAKERIKSLIEEINKKYKPLFEKKDNSRWCFPVEGGKIYDIGGKGSGFHPAYPKPAYSFYDGNRHGGHPGHDIFIHDKNIDCIDDETGKPVKVLSITHGVVISTNEKWKPGQPRGGIYAWVYNPVLKKFFYYAHLDRIFVKKGDVLSPCSPIGTVGKTGFVASFKKPCHLHLMILDFNDGKMTPFNPFPVFLKLFKKKKK